MKGCAKLFAWMAARPTAESPQRLDGASSGTLLLEHRSGDRTGADGTMAKALLIESTPSVLTLTEQTTASGEKKLIARGEFGRCDVPTANGRIYPRRLIEREIGRLKENLKRRRVLGTLDHPADGKTSLKSVSHVITDLSVDGNGVVHGEAEVLNTPEGQILRALIEGSVEIGISSRGFGSTRPSAGKVEGDEVQDDFVLRTYDFVADPAVRSANPAFVTEDVDDETLAQMFLAEFPELAGQIPAPLDEGAPEGEEVVRERVRAELREEFERHVRDEVVALRSEVADELREEFASDPEVGGAKAMLAQIAEQVAAYRQYPGEEAVRDALKAAELEVAESREQIDELEQRERVARLNLHMERRIAEVRSKDTVRKLARVDECVDEVELDARLEAILGDLPGAEDGYVSREEAELRESVARLEGQLSEAESKVAELSEKMRRAETLVKRADAQVGQLRDQLAEAEEQRTSAVQDAEEAQRKLAESEERHGLELYKRDKVAGLSNGRELLSLLEAVQDRGGVDRVVELRGSRTMRDGELEAMRHSVAGLSGEPGAGPIVEDEKPRGAGISGDPNVLGLSWEDQCKLAGV